MSRSMNDARQAIRWIVYRKAGASIGAGACVEVMVASRSVFIRDSKQNDLPGRPVIEVSLDAWLSVIDEVIGSRPLADNGELRIDVADDGSARFTDTVTGAHLDFTSAEYAAFEHGVRAGEFTPELIPA